MPVPLGKSIKVSDDVYEELKRLRRVLGVESPNQVIRRLLELCGDGVTLSKEVNGVTPRKRGDPLAAAASCVARVLRRGARGRTYVVECRDGRRAVVPEETIPRLVEMLGDAILVEE